MTKIFDVSQSLHAGMTMWPGVVPAPSRDVQSSLETGDVVTASAWSFHCHAGTHIDAPSHVLGDGLTVDRIDPAACIGPAVVVQIRTEVTEIGPNELAAVLPEQYPGRVLLKTANSNSSSTEFDQDFVALAPEGAEFLVRRGTSLVGIDAPSVESFARLQNAAREGLRTHRILLERDCVIVEGLDLRYVPVGRYVIVCLPLPLRDSEASPVRAVLYSENSEHEVRRPEVGYPVSPGSH